MVFLHSDEFEAQAAAKTWNLEQKQRQAPVAKCIAKTSWYYYNPQPATASCFPHEIIVDHEKAACNTFRRSCRKYLRRIA